jgi:hypothetical protein
MSEGEVSEGTLNVNIELPIAKRLCDAVGVYNSGVLRFVSHCDFLRW